MTKSDEKNKETSKSSWPKKRRFEGDRSKSEVVPTNEAPAESSKIWERYISEKAIGYNSFNFHGTLDKFEKETLTAPQKVLFQNSCFGQFLDMPKVINSSNIVNNLIMRSGCFSDVKRNDALLVEIGGKVRAFTKKQFESITGLLFVDDYRGCDYDVIHSGGVYEMLFPEGASHKRSRISGLLEESRNWEDEVRVKYLLIYFLANILLADHQNVKIPNIEYLKMVDNLEEFNKHPWGNVVWNFFIHRTQATIIRERLKNSNDPKRKTINLSGFMLPLQIWAYECMPIFSELELCKLVSPEAIPLMRRWNSVSYITELKTFNISWQSPLTEFLQLKVSEDRDDDKKQVILPMHITKTKMDQRKRRRRNEEVILSIFADKTAPKPPEASDDCDEDDVGGFDSFPITKSKEDWRELRRRDKEKIERLENEILHLKQEVATLRKENSSTANRATSKVYPHPFRGNPMSKPNHAAAAKLGKWLKKGLSYDKRAANKYTDNFDKLKWPLDFTVVVTYSKSFLYTLYAHKQWLSAMHMSVAFYYMRRKMDNMRRKGKISHDNHICTTTDSYFSIYLVRAWNEFVDPNKNQKEFVWDDQKNLMKYFTGKQNCSWPWVDVNKVYIPYHDKDHWVLLVVSLQSRTITVYDSMMKIGTSPGMKVDDGVQVMAKCLPIILCSINPFKTSAPFTIAHYQEMPQQSNTNDCGMFVIKAAEFLMHGLPLSQLSQTDMDMYRQKLCLQLFFHAVRKHKLKKRNMET